MDDLIPQVTVPEGTRGPWRVERFEVSEEAARFSQLRAAVSTSRRGAIRPGIYTRLVRDGTVVMSDSLDERRDHLEFLAHARGRLLIAGLGLGVVLGAVLRKRGVTSVLVIEKSPHVIDLVAHHYEDPRLRVVCDDIFEALPRIKREPLFDAAWYDIWDYLSLDNLAEMTKLKRRFARRCRWQGCWGEAFLRHHRHR